MPFFLQHWCTFSSNCQTWLIQFPFHLHLLKPCLLAPTYSCAHATVLFDMFGQVNDILRRFWIPDILWNLQPWFYKRNRLSPASPRGLSASQDISPLPAFPPMADLHVCGSSHVSASSGMWGFVPSTRHLWLLLEVFSQTPSLTVFEHLLKESVFFAMEQLLLWNLYVQQCLYSLLYAM